MWHQLYCKQQLPEQGIACGYFQMRSHNAHTVDEHVMTPAERDLTWHQIAKPAATQVPVTTATVLAAPMVLSARLPVTHS
jgi:hypothetical protein